MQSQLHIEHSRSSLLLCLAVLFSGLTRSAAHWRPLRPSAISELLGLVDEYEQAHQDLHFTVRQDASTVTQFVLPAYLHQLPDDQLLHDARRPSSPHLLDDAYAQLHVGVKHVRSPYFNIYGRRRRR